jgi:hypothetical protein
MRNQERGTTKEKKPYPPQIQRKLWNIFRNGDKRLLERLTSPESQATTHTRLPPRPSDASSISASAEKIVRATARATEMVQSDG